MRTLLLTLSLVFTTTAIAQDAEIKLLEKIAQQGNAAMQFILGLQYEMEAQDYEKAVEWYQKSAEQGDSDAQSRLGKLYATGRGVPRDYQKALAWLEKAARQNDAEAQFNLGVMYQFGLGVQENYLKVEKWWKAAAKRGSAKAQFNLGVLYSQGDHLKQNYRLAAKLFKKAARQDVSEAAFNLGVMYRNGQGVSRNLVLALSFFYIIHPKGSEFAPENLAEEIGAESKLRLKEKLPEILLATVLTEVKLLESELNQKAIAKAKKYAYKFRKKYLLKST